MNKYTDNDIRKIKKITCKIAGDYLGVSSMSISIGLRQNKLPIGYAINNYGNKWSYYIINERLIAYKYGKISDLSLNIIENKLNNIVNELIVYLKKELIVYLKNK